MIVSVASYLIMIPVVEFVKTESLALVEEKTVAPPN
jgi:hypothetical protein